MVNDILCAIWSSHTSSQDAMNNSLALAAGLFVRWFIPEPRRHLL